MLVGESSNVSRVPFRKHVRHRKRQVLDQAQVVNAALALLDEVGLDELTMRRVAERLNVKAASLYRHVHNKEELLALLGDEISAEIPLPRADGCSPIVMQRESSPARRQPGQDASGILRQSWGFCVQQA